MTVSAVYTVHCGWCKATDRYHDDLAPKHTRVVEDAFEERGWQLTNHAGPRGYDSACPRCWSVYGGRKVLKGKRLRRRVRMYLVREEFEPVATAFTEKDAREAIGVMADLMGFDEHRWDGRHMTATSSTWPRGDGQLLRRWDIRLVDVFR